MDGCLYVGENVGGVYLVMENRDIGEEMLVAASRVFWMGMGCKVGVVLS